MISPEQLAASGTEHGHQAATFCYFNINATKYPLAQWLFAVPNGFFGSAGQKAKMKAEGLKSGVPDMILPVSKFRAVDDMPWCGLFVELKTLEHKRVNNPLAGCSDEQKAWVAFLRSQGYQCEVAYGWQEAVKVIVEYLE